MFVIRVRTPEDADSTEVVQLVERLCDEEGLVLKTKRPLRTLPGSTHWHWRHEQSVGTLEVTLWPGGSIVWLSVHANRVGPWTRGTAIRLGRAIKKEFGKSAR